MCFLRAHRETLIAHVRVAVECVAELGENDISFESDILKKEINSGIRTRIRRTDVLKGASS